MPDSSPPVTLDPATPAHRAALESLLQLYTHDFSELWTGTLRGELDEQGRFPAYPSLDAYWREEGRVPLLIRAGGHIAGFALLNRESHTGRPVERNVAEFFVVRKHRRAGVGRAAFHAILDRYPGQWETAVARKNAAALAFWRRVVAAYPRVAGLEEIDVDDTRWNGPVLRYRVLTP